MATNNLLDTIKKKITEEFLKCNICFDEDVSTRRLPCTHNCCLNCLRKIAEYQYQFPCPMCRSTIYVPRGGVDQFPEDVPVKKMMEFASTFHLAGTAFCSEHETKTLDLYCKTDNTLICGTCLVKEHKGHNYVTIEEAAEEKRECFQRMASLQEKTLHEIQNENSKLQEIKTKIQHQEANVTEIAEKFKMSIERSCDLLCNKTHVILSAELNKIEEQQKKLQDQEDEAKKAKKMYDSLLQQPDVEMILNAHSVEQLKPKIRDAPIIPKDVTTITLPEEDVETLLANMMLVQLKIETQLAEKLTMVETFKRLRIPTRIKRIVASGNKIYVLSEAKVEVFAEQGQPSKVINGFHDPQDIAVLPSGDILAIDKGCVKMAYISEDRIITLIDTFKLSKPRSIAVDRKCLVHVCEENGDIKVFGIEILPDNSQRTVLSLKWPYKNNNIRLYISPSNDNIYCFNRENIVVFGPSGSRVHTINVGSLCEGIGMKITDVAVDVYGHTLIAVEGLFKKDMLVVLDNYMQSKQMFELPSAGEHIAVNSNHGCLVHGQKDGQVVLYKYAD